MPSVPSRSSITAALLLVVAAAWSWWSRGHAVAVSAPSGVATGAPAAARSDVTRASIGFRSRELLIEHYRKHGHEFGSVSMGEYLALAQALRERTAGGDVL